MGLRSPRWRRTLMRYQILHRTRYQYAAPVRESFNEVRLKPVTNADQNRRILPSEGAAGVSLRHYEDFTPIDSSF